MVDRVRPWVCQQEACFFRSFFSSFFLLRSKIVGVFTITKVERGCARLLISHLLSRVRLHSTQGSKMLRFSKKKHNTKMWTLLLYTTRQYGHSNFTLHQAGRKKKLSGCQCCHIIWCLSCQLSSLSSVTDG